MRFRKSIAAGIGDIKFSVIKCYTLRFIPHFDCCDNVITIQVYLGDIATFICLTERSLVGIGSYIKVASVIDAHMPAVRYVFSLGYNLAVRPDEIDYV